MFGALDLATGKMFYRFRDRKRRQEFLTFLRQLRRRYTGKLYVVCDNFSPPTKREVIDWCAANIVELVFTRPMRRGSTGSSPNSLPCAISPSMAVTTQTTPPKSTPTAATSDGETKPLCPNGTSPSDPKSAHPITYPTPLDEALVTNCY
jgi:hypothetical protein